jgi:ribosome biogenesis GTPase A
MYSADPPGKAFATSSLPGLTRKLTGTVKIYEDPHVYVYDTPGVMVPYLGKGAQGAERGLKLALTGESPRYPAKS